MNTKNKLTNALQSNKITIVMLMLMLLIIPLSSTAPTFKTTPSITGCEIAPVIRETLKVGQSFDFNFHVFNLSNGVQLSNSTLSCYFHFYNQTGDHVYGIVLNNDPLSEHFVINEWANRMTGDYIPTVGHYAYLVQCNGTSSVGGCADKGGFIVTNTGEPEAAGGVIVLFSILFLLIIIGVTYVIITSIGHAVTLDFDIKDLSMNYGIYFGLVGTYMLYNNYIADPTITNLLLIFVKVGVATNIFLPTIYFILTLTIGSWLQQRVRGVDYGN